MKDDNDFDPFLNTLEDLLAHEETQSRKRVKVKDIEDEDDSVKIVSITSSAFNSTVSTGNSKSIAAERPARPIKSKSIQGPQDPLPANEATSQLMWEAKLSFIFQQICDLALGFRAEVRRSLVKPKKERIQLKHDKKTYIYLILM